MSIDIACGVARSNPGVVAWTAQRRRVQTLLMLFNLSRLYWFSVT